MSKSQRLFHFRPILKKRHKITVIFIMGKVDGQRFCDFLSRWDEPLNMKIVSEIDAPLAIE